MAILTCDRHGNIGQGSRKDPAPFCDPRRFECQLREEPAGLGGHLRRAREKEAGRKGEDRALKSEFLVELHE